MTYVLDNSLRTCGTITNYTIATLRLNSCSCLIHMEKKGMTDCRGMSSNEQHGAPTLHHINHHRLHSGLV